VVGRSRRPGPFEVASFSIVSISAAGVVTFSAPANVVAGIEGAVLVLPGGVSPALSAETDSLTATVTSWFGAAPAVGDVWASLGFYGFAVVSPVDSSLPVLDSSGLFS
jgi:hypothetical protein